MHFYSGSVMYFCSGVDNKIDMTGGASSKFPSIKGN
jgi:hypothetical protein